jgi:hypothetical protein
MAGLEIVDVVEQKRLNDAFAGGFLGLDNISVFDRSASLPTGGSLEQADGTAWMAFYCQNMLEMEKKSEAPRYCDRQLIRGTNLCCRSSGFP